MKRTPIKRKTPLRSKTQLRSHKPIKSKPKRPRTWQEKGHMERVAQCPCLIGNQHCRGRITVHHVSGAGMGLKASDFETLALCEGHHLAGPESIEDMGSRAWERHHNVTQAHLLMVQRLYMAKVFPDWCVFTGERADPAIDQVQRILDTPSGQG